MKAKNTRLIALTAILAVAAGSVRGDVFHMSPGQTSLDFVTVGNPHNGVSNLFYGNVDYNYQIGKYEVTASQYAEFLNAKARGDAYGLYNSHMADTTDGCGIARIGNQGTYSYSVASGFVNRPLNCISFWDACRFVNWLHNGQGSGDTETGAYTLNGYMGDDGRTIVKNTGAKYWIPTENEWYKAAYYDPNKVGGAGYYQFPTKSDSPPTTLQANMRETRYPNTPPYTTEVGAFPNAPGPYGTFDQGGNVFEWDEAVISNASRGARGGAFTAFMADGLFAAMRTEFSPTYETPIIGLRIAGVPEPSTFALLGMGVIGLLGYAWRRRKS